MNMKWLVWITLCFSFVLAKECPSPDGYFPHETQCDKYYDCEDGLARERLCPDGLVFNEKGKAQLHCESPYEVDCSNRPELQPAKETEDCPRQYGLFPHKNECRSFWNCVEGKGTKSSCPEALVFNTKKGTCDWPTNVDDCPTDEVEEIKDAECLKRSGVFPDKNDCRVFWTCVEGLGRRSICPDGLGFNPKRSSCDWADALENCELGKYYDFTCPEDLDITHGDHVYYPFPDDCRKHFACIKGTSKKMLLRLLTCDIGLVYDTETERCTVPERVQGCQDYYSKAPPPTTQAPRLQRQSRKAVDTST